MLSDYQLLIESIFAQTSEADRTFTTADIEKCAAELKINVRNLADVRYRYESRYPLPFGNYTIVGRGKSKYEFVPLSKPNLIHVPQDIEEFASVVDAPDNTPLWIKPFLGKDEQATLSRLERSGVLASMLGMSSLIKLQDHCRTHISSGQIEVDEVCVGQDSDGQKYIIPIAAKGGREKISYGHIHNLGLFCVEKYPNLTPRIVAIYRHPNDDVFVLTFSWDGHPDDIKVDQAHLLKLK